MKTMQTLILSTFLVITASAQEILKHRAWESHNGGVLKATLVKVDGDQVTMKPAVKPNVTFDINLLTKHDKDFIETERDRINKMIEDGFFFQNLN